MEEVARYLFETGMLKRVRRSGWWAENVREPESVADHSYRTAIIAFILARMEGLDEDAASRICAAGVFHDVQEARLGDMHKITQKYLPPDHEVEKKVESDQTKDLPPQVRGSILRLQSLSGKEQEILKDADYLECAIQAREYAEIGHKGAESWIPSIGEKLRTRSAKKIYASMKGMSPGAWWSGLKRME